MLVSPSNPEYPSPDIAGLPRVCCVKCLCKSVSIKLQNLIHVQFIINTDWKQLNFAQPLNF